MFATSCQGLGYVEFVLIFVELLIDASLVRVSWRRLIYLSGCVDMNIKGVAYRTIWRSSDRLAVEIIDQTRLPHEFVVMRLVCVEDVAHAIRLMRVRGAPLIGAAAAYGVALAMQFCASDVALSQACQLLLETRPTAVNLRWALARMRARLSLVAVSDRVEQAWLEAELIADEDVATNRAIGLHGLDLITDMWKTKQSVVNILTHCNAGWLATVDWGTALSPIYAAHDAGVPVHVWVDETRPRNQGASLTAWELQQHGVPFTLIVDNVGGHLMQHGQVDMVIVGTDRTAANGDVCNKVGTYLKALAAFDNDVPFYVALPGSTIDWQIHDGVKDIPIEQRDGNEVVQMRGRNADGELVVVDIAPAGSAVVNYAFDVTPARLVTALITERGVCAATRNGLAGLYPGMGDV
jgi:methylthioribose-1-phosphate isomerase